MAAGSSFKLTYATMFNPPEELHTRFNEALDKVRANLGKEHAMIIDGKDVFTKDKFEDRSPTNTDIILGIFQKGSSRGCQQSHGCSPKGFSVVESYEMAGTCITGATRC